MRIAVVCFPTVGGSGILATGLGQAIADRGHEVHFVAYQPPVRFEPSPNRFYHQVELPRPEVANNRAPLPASPYLMPLAAALGQVCRRHSIDIIHVHYAVPHAHAAQIARESLPESPPLIVTLHGTDVSSWSQQEGYRALLRSVLEKSDTVTAVSDHLCVEAETSLGLTRPVERIYNFCTSRGPVRSRQETRRELGIEDTELVALHMSNLRPVKNFELVLRAFAGSNVDKLLVLDGGEFSEYRSLADELNLGSRLLVRKTNWVEDYVEAADLGLYASWQESFGLGILETMQGGRPVVTTAVGGVPEVVSSTGLLSEAGQLQPLLDNLNRLADDRTLLSSLGKRARHRAESEFSLPRAVDCYEELYQRVLRSSLELKTSCRE